MLIFAGEMTFPLVDSIKPIEHKYNTGDKPVLVACTDKNALDILNDSIDL